MNKYPIQLNCNICLGLDPDATYFCILSCTPGHIYHAKCWESWVRKGNKSCPDDREEITHVIVRGKVLKISQCLALDQRCFLCNQEYEGERPILTCLSCKLSPCHAKCLKDISMQKIPDFNLYQTCEECQYQMRQYQIVQWQYLQQVNRKLTQRYFQLNREISNADKQIEQIKRQKENLQRQRNIVLDRLARNQNRNQDILDHIRDREGNEDL